jgi:hypothetical protein
MESLGGAMTMKIETDFRMSFARFVTPSYFRIAIPSWRFVGVEMKPKPKPEGLSREELLDLFGRDLNPSDKKRQKLTKTEVQEQDLALNIRRALYPAETGKA